MSPGAGVRDHHYAVSLKLSVWGPRPCRPLSHRPGSVCHSQWAWPGPMGFGFSFLRTPGGTVQPADISLGPPVVPTFASEAMRSHEALPFGLGKLRHQVGW